jgi:hypothetical protein
MSTSLLYHAFGVRGYRYVKTGYVEGEVVFTIVQPRESYRCPVCGSDDVIGRGQRTRRFRIYAESTGIRMLHTFARTLRLHVMGILAYYDHSISTGPLEGTNNKIKTMKRQPTPPRPAVRRGTSGRTARRSRAESGPAWGAARRPRRRSCRTVRVFPEGCARSVPRSYRASGTG